MSLRRRLELLQWAAAHDAWIVEDDYDSDYRYGGAPIASLQGLDDQHRVIYVGTFSKTIFPQLRLGYVVAPDDLVDAFISARAAVNLGPPLLAQMVLADFIAEGHFLRHLRRMRKRYEARRDALLQALHIELNGVLQPGPADAGIHLTTWLAPEIDDRTLFSHAREHQVTAVPLSWMYRRAPARKGLILGFASSTPEEIQLGVRRLARAIAAASNGKDSGTVTR
jgi:GntR family transcriptional regulator/MocR family aminotransferase